MGDQSVDWRLVLTVALVSTLAASSGSPPPKPNAFTSEISQAGFRFNSQGGVFGPVVGVEQETSQDGGLSPTDFKDPAYEVADNADQDRA